MAQMTPDEKANRNTIPADVLADAVRVAQDYDAPSFVTKRKETIYVASQDGFTVSTVEKNLVYATAYPSGRVIVHIKPPAQ